MKRQMFRNVALLVFAVLLLASWLFWQRFDATQERVGRVESSTEQLMRDLRANNRRAKLLEQLDNLTIDETTATRLDILRHLQLEQSDLEFVINSKSVQKVNGTDLHVRYFTIRSRSTTYEKALATADWLHNSGKVTLQGVVLRPGSEAGDSVDIELKGVLYGLEKKQT